jgi:hypothetical protein
MNSALTRRSFAVAAAGLTQVFAQTTKRTGRALPAPIIGVCSGSFALTDPSPDTLLRAMQSTPLRVVSLGQPHFDPWRTGTSGMTAMRELRSKFADAGVLIRSVSVDIALSRTDAEISRMLAMANVLDVRHVAAEVAFSMLERINELARKHAAVVALRNTPELKTAMEMQSAIHTFGSLGLAPDIGKIEAGASDPIDMLRRSGGRIFEIRFRAGSPKMAETLRKARYEHAAIPLFVDVAKPEEIDRALTFYRESTREKPAEPRRPRE